LGSKCRQREKALPSERSDVLSKIRKDFDAGIERS
jgi:hypothetical protein